MKWILSISVLIALSCGIQTKTEQLPIKEALEFCRANKMDTTLCLLVDMSIHSGKKRMRIYDFQKNTLVTEGICTHGCGRADWGKESTASKPLFSNTPDSHLSSLGKYRIGKRGWSNWGIHVNYRLHGLEKTNNNAFKRTIVLHSWDWVSDEPTYPKGAPESWGCPAVSNNFMHQLDTLLQPKKNVLLWIYQSN